METYWKAILAAACAVALAIGAYQTVQVTRLKRKVAEMKQSGGSAGPKTENEALKRRVAALERTATQLLAMLLRSRNGGSMPAGGKGGRGLTGKLQNLRADVDAILTGDALSTEEGRKRLHRLVEQAQTQAREKVRNRWRALFEHRVDKAIKGFSDDVGLSQDQHDQVSKQVYAAIDAVWEIRRAYRQGEITPAQFFEKSRQVVKDLDAKVKPILGDEKFEKFKAARKKFTRR